LGLALPPPHRKLLDRSREAACAALGDAAYAIALAEGRALTREEAVAVALAEPVAGAVSDGD
jgi:hypothetical protein